MRNVPNFLLLVLFLFAMTSARSHAMEGPPVEDTQQILPLALKYRVQINEMIESMPAERSGFDNILAHYHKTLLPATDGSASSETDPCYGFMSLQL